MYHANYLKYLIVLSALLANTCEIYLEALPIWKGYADKFLICN